MSARTSGPALVRVSISATDEEWELVGERANRQRMSGSRYLVAAALSEGGAHPVAGGDERDLLEAVRRLRPLLSGGAGGLSGYGMRERLAVLFAAWAGGLAAAGRGAELRAVLAPALGDEGAGRIAAAFAPASQARTTASNRPEDRTGGPESWQQGSLL